MFEISVFVGIQARIWSQNCEKLRSTHLAGRAGNLVNMDGLAKSHFLCKIAPKSSPKRSQDHLWAPFWAALASRWRLFGAPWATYFRRGRLLCVLCGFVWQGVPPGVSRRQGRRSSGTMGKLHFDLLDDGFTEGKQTLGQSGGGYPS